MGKVVKYCNACEEGFAEKFGFCPNCGALLQAFELNPLATMTPKESKADPIDTAGTFVPPVAAVPIALDSPAASDFSAASSVPAVTAFEFSDEIFEDDEVTASGKVDEIETAPAATVVAQNVPSELTAPAAAASVIAPHNIYDVTPNTRPVVIDYQPTIVYEKNVKQRNSLLLGAFAIGLIVLTGSYVYSMFNKYLDISAIDSPSLLSYVEEVDPVPMELEPEEKKAKDDGGGGGGGGKEEETQASKGRTATQVDNPMFAPSSKMDRVTDPDIAIRAATQGNRQEKQADENYGLPTGLSGRSDGTGSGGGLGEGRGRGQGTGNGTGLGSGNGSGSGNGDGNGNGDGTGDGDGITVKTKPPQPVGPTEGLKILAKPRANYTDAARQNQVQGKVVLRVTFSASGAIGAISVISGLGNGLTEQAIAAARGIRFEPAKRGGVAYTVTKPVEYSFTIY